MPRKRACFVSSFGFSRSPFSMSEIVRVLIPECRDNAAFVSPCCTLNLLRLFVATAGVLLHFHGLDITSFFAGFPEIARRTKMYSMDQWLASSMPWGIPGNPRGGQDRARHKTAGRSHRRRLRCSRWLSRSRCAQTYPYSQRRGWRCGGVIRCGGSLQHQSPNHKSVAEKSQALRHALGSCSRPHSGQR